MFGAEVERSVERKYSSDIDCVKMYRVGVYLDQWFLDSIGRGSQWEQEAVLEISFWCNSSFCGQFLFF